MLRAPLLDEIGYLPIDRVGANLFFQLIGRRYERGPMILTSNQSFGAWGEVFGESVQGRWRRRAIAGCGASSASAAALAAASPSAADGVNPNTSATVCSMKSNASG